jgi:hypothetical protein
MPHPLLADMLQPESSSNFFFSSSSALSISFYKMLNAPTNQQPATNWRQGMRPKSDGRLYSVQIFPSLRKVPSFRRGRGCTYRYGSTTKRVVRPKTRSDGWWILVVQRLWRSPGDNLAGHVARIQKASEYIHNFRLKIRNRKASIMISGHRGVDNTTFETDLEFRNFAAGFTPFVYLIIFSSLMFCKCVLFCSSCFIKGGADFTDTFQNSHMSSELVRALSLHTENYNIS